MFEATAATTTGVSAGERGEDLIAVDIEQPPPSVLCSILFSLLCFLLYFSPTVSLVSTISTLIEPSLRVFVSCLLLLYHVRLSSVSVAPACTTTTFITVHS